MKSLQIIGILLLGFVAPLFSQSGLEQIEANEGARFPTEVSRAIKYASDKQVTIRFALMSEVFELMSYANTEVFTTYNRNISIEETTKYYYQSHEDFFGPGHIVLPFAVSTNHYHDDKVDFLAILSSSEKKLNGRIVYSNIDYTKENEKVNILMKSIDTEQLVKLAVLN